MGSFGILSFYGIRLRTAQVENSKKIKNAISELRTEKYIISRVVRVYSAVWTSGRPRPVHIDMDLIDYDCIEQKARLKFIY